MQLIGCLHRLGLERMRWREETMWAVGISTTLYVCYVDSYVDGIVRLKLLTRFIYPFAC